MLSTEQAREVEVNYAAQVNQVVGKSLTLSGWKNLMSIDVVLRWQNHKSITELVDSVASQLLSSQQVAWLIEHDLSLVEVLRGQFSDELLPEVEHYLCGPWNETIGVSVFGFSGRDQSMTSSDGGNESCGL